MTNNVGHFENIIICVSSYENSLFSSVFQFLIGLFSWYSVFLFFIIEINLLTEA